MLPAVRFLVLLVALVACGESDDSPAPREVAFDVTVGDAGLSEEVSFRIPPNTRSITLIVEGSPDALLALGTFSVGDGTDLVQLPEGAPGPAMEMSYVQEQIGQMPGQLYQSIRLGTYTHLYPYRPDQTVIPGTGRLRIASNRAGPATVTILMPEDNAEAVLPLTFYLVSDTLADPISTTFTSELGRLFAQAGITVRTNGLERLTGTALERITDFNEPQETPASQSAMLPGLVADRTTDGRTRRVLRRRIAQRRRGSLARNTGTTDAWQLLLRRDRARRISGDRTGAGDGTRGRAFHGAAARAESRHLRSHVSGSSRRHDTRCRQLDGRRHAADCGPDLRAHAQRAAGRAVMLSNNR
jgi:hypothetical protein